jgi:periplasmic protein TonB
MAYADQGMSRNRAIALGIVAVLHAFLGYAFITGLALKAVKAIVNPLESVNIEEEKPPPEEPPPPPPKDIEIPPYVPPPEVSIDIPPAPNAPTVQNTIPDPVPRPFVQQAPVQEAPPPPPAGPTQQAQFDARSTAVSDEDYPAAALRAEEEGVTKVRVTIGLNGRVSACEVVTSSGFPRLDEKTCKIAQTRWRSKPALRDGTPIESTVVKAIRWQIRR